MNDEIIHGDRGIELPRNRAYDIHRDNDTFTTPSITLYDIDYAILWHIQKNIQPTIEENGNIINVPVMIAAGEKWSQIQRHGYLRDKSRIAMTPLIILKRNSITNDPRMNKLEINGMNNATNIIIFPDDQMNNKNDWIHKTYNTKESKTYYLSAIPELIRVSYDIYIWTELQAQINKIVEQILPQNKKLWGDAFKFVTNVGDCSFETLNNTGEDRIIRATINIEVEGQIQNEYDLKESTVQKAFSIKRVDFKNEVEQDEIYPYILPKIIKPGYTRRPSKNF